jgi:hypothetical protein
MIRDKCMSENGTSCEPHLTHASLRHDPGGLQFSVHGYFVDGSRFGYFVDGNTHEIEIHMSSCVEIHMRSVWVFR